MNNRLTQWAPYIGALGIAMIAAAFLLGIVTGVRRDVLLLMAGVGIVLIAFYVLTRPREELREALTGRTALYGSNSLILAIAFIGILAAGNFIINRQFNERIDLTANKAHTLSQQTVQVLQELDRPVKVIVFSTPETDSQVREARDLLRDYQLKTTQLQVEFVDPDANPALARQYDDALPGTVVFARDNRTEKVYTFDENNFTNAILKVTRTQQPAIYFTTGHGESSPTDFENTGLSSVADFLKQINYKVEVLNMAAVSATETITGGMPADISALVIAGPKNPFSAEDEQRIKQYLDGGGRVLLMADFDTNPGLQDLLASWSLALQNNLVVDPALNYRGQPLIPVFVNFPTSPVTANLEQFGVYLPGTRSILDTELDTVIKTPLLKTTEQACAKTDIAALREQQTQIQCEPGKDPQGPFVVAYSVEGTGATEGAGADKRGRLIVIGNASFVTNRFVSSQDAFGNQQFFSNIINWLAGQEALIAIPPRESSLRSLSPLTGDEVNLVFWSNVALVPLAVLLLGGIIWWRRR